MNRSYVKSVVLGVVTAAALSSSGCAKTEVHAEDVPIFSKDTPGLLLAAEPGTPGDAEGAKPTPDTNAPPADPDVKVVQTPTTPKNLQVSPALGEVLKLAQAGLSEEVILTYISNSTIVYNLTSDDIVYLNDLGVSTAVITELIKRDNSAEALALKKAAGSASPLPPGIALNTPATNIFYNSKPAPVANTVPDPAVVEPPPPAVVEAPPSMPAPVAVAADAPAASFYEPLSPYGNWIQVENYGLCWQPTVAVVNTSWRPYADHGRWYWSDAGWYWYSDYSWGWAPFHYGRWSSSPRVGWFWVPDHVWGPSWVTWRYSDSYCGWAPLPPYAHYVHGSGLHYRSGSVSFGFSFGFGALDYNFVSWNRFCDPSPRHHFVRHSDKTVIFNNTKVVNKYVVKNGDLIVNEGIPVQDVSRRSRTEITRIGIRNAPLPADRTSRPERIINEGGSGLAVVRPELPGRPSVRPASENRAPRSGSGERENRVPRSDARAATPTLSDSTRRTTFGNAPIPKNPEANPRQQQARPQERETVRNLFGAPGRPQRASGNQSTASTESQESNSGAGGGKEVPDAAKTSPAQERPQTVFPRRPGNGAGRIAAPDAAKTDESRPTTSAPDLSTPAQTAPNRRTETISRPTRPAFSESKGTSFGRPINEASLARNPFEPVARPSASNPARPVASEANRVTPGPAATPLPSRREGGQPGITHLPSTVTGPTPAPRQRVAQQQAPTFNAPQPITRTPPAITRAPAPITRGPAPITRAPEARPPVFHQQNQGRPQAVTPPPAYRPNVGTPSFSRPAPAASAPPPMRSAPPAIQSAPPPQGRSAGQQPSGGGSGRPSRRDGN